MKYPFTNFSKRVEGENQQVHLIFNIQYLSKILITEIEFNARFHRRGALSESACKPLLGLLCALSFSLGVELSQALPGLSEVA